MKTKKIIFLILFILGGVNIHAQIITKHGIIAGGGIGKIDAKMNSANNIKNSDVSFKSDYSLGYRLRLDPGINPFYIDTDINIGMKNWKSSYSESLTQPPIREASSQYYYASMGGILNYYLYPGLSIGLGIEPTYYFYQDGEKSSNKFDIPLLGKAAYNFKKFEVGLTYKYGMTDIIKTDHIKSGKFRSIQLSLFIPF